MKVNLAGTILVLKKHIKTIPTIHIKNNDQMNKISSLLLGAIFMLVFSQSILAQKQNYNFKEGTVTYQINIKEKTAGAASGLSMLNGSTLTWSLQDKNQRADFVLAGMAQLALMNNSQADLSVFLLDVPLLLEPTAVKIDSWQEITNLLNENTGSALNEAPSQTTDVKISYDKKKKKKIAKYKCKKASVQIGEMTDVMTVYVTDDLRSEALQGFQENFGNMQGFPLSFELDLDDITIEIVAKEIKKSKLDKSLFEISDKYTTKSVKEFEEDMKTEFGEESEEGTFGL